MDHYATLGVNKNATPDEIKKAYRKLASQHHPDKGGDTTKFQEIQTAYDTLSDPDKRAMYDNPQPQGFNMGPGGFQFHMGPGMDINDIFGQMFGGGNPFGQQNRNHRQILRTQIQVSLLEAYNGGSQTLKVNTPQGVKVIDIKIPKGVHTGQQAKFDQVIPNAVLLVEFLVMPDLKFERRQNDLVANHMVSILDLVVGSTFQFTTIDEKIIEVKIPARTQPYMMLKIAGYGMPAGNSGQYGDQLILLKPFMPDNISQDIVDAILRNRGN